MLLSDNVSLQIFMLALDEFVYVCNVLVMHLHEMINKCLGNFCPIVLGGHGHCFCMSTDKLQQSKY